MTRRNTLKMEVKRMIRNIFTLLVWSKKNLHCERRKKLIYEKFARIKNGEKTIGMPSWKCDYDMNEKTWNSAAAVVVEWGLKRMSFPSNDAHHLLILLIPSHTLVVRRNCGKRAGEKGENHFEQKHWIAFWAIYQFCMLLILTRWMAHSTLSLASYILLLYLLHYLLSSSHCLVSMYRYLDWILWLSED